MSFFIADLALGAAELETAKAGILGASVVAGIAGILILWKRTPASLVRPVSATRLQPMRNR
jgi:Na+/H+ antiporter NhaA